MKTGCIYKIKNKINKKCYIGQTSRGFKVRVSEHLRSARSGNRNSAIHKALRKYGEANFEFTIVVDNVPEDLLDGLEINVIAAEQAYGKYGYNLGEGGNTNRNRIVSTETRHKLSKAKLGKKMNLTDEERAVLSENMKGTNNPMYGKTHTEETKRMISALNKGRRASESTKKKLSDSCKGTKSYRALLIGIYSNKDECVYLAHGDFYKICDRYKLPMSALRASYQNNGRPLYSKTRKEDMLRLIENNTLQFKGWYAKKMERVRL